jgi:hypothetical protein
MAESRMVRMAASRLLRKVGHRNRSDRCSRGSVHEEQFNTIGSIFKPQCLRATFFRLSNN